MTDKPPKDAVAALECLIVDAELARDCAKRRGSLDVDQHDTELAALRWALRMAREMEETT